MSPKEQAARSGIDTNEIAAKISQFIMTSNAVIDQLAANNSYFNIWDRCLALNPNDIDPFGRPKTLTAARFIIREQILETLIQESRQALEETHSDLRNNGWVIIVRHPETGESRQLHEFDYSPPIHGFAAIVRGDNRPEVWPLFNGEQLRIDKQPLNETQPEHLPAFSGLEQFFAQR